MAVMDVSRQRRSLLDDATVLNHLPAELLEIIKDHASPKILDAVSEAALSPRLTELIFTHFEPTFPDICARWILNSGDLKRILDIASALSRILPFAPYLASFLGHSPNGSPALGHPPPVQLSLPDPGTVLQLLDDEFLLRYLVTLWRLISFDSRRFSRSISPAFVQKLFSHDSRPVRYVAVRIFCQLLHASDVKLESLIGRYVGTSDPIIAELDGVPVDYGFLTLHEQARVKRVLSLREKVQEMSTEAEIEPLTQNLTSYVAAYGDVLLPCPSGRTGDPSSLVLTSTTTKNLECLARMLHNNDPVLLHGLPGSGKTSLVHEIARDLGMYSSMVTLHLNEQTDAKMLVGLYSTDSKPGSFQWRPGVLTTAVKEGRWVLVEDLDRAPTEVLSTLLPLIERKELLIPSRGETIRAAKSFRLFATVRTTRGMNGRENLPTIVGMRFWQSMHAEPLTEPELEEVILQTFPILRKFVPGVLAVYNRLTRLGQHPTQIAGGRSLVDRRLNLRDLLKWCQRLRECLSTAGSVSGDEPISESTRDWMFMEALDCFVGSCPDVELGKKLASAIAEEMHMSAERAEHYITTHTPTLEENESNFSIGRVRLRKQKFSERVQKSKRPFASTSHAKKLLEQIAIAVRLSEPVLLVGETGIGKTTVVQQLAESLGHKLIAVNLSQQSEVGDLLGGFKPVNVRTLAVPLKEDFEDLFSATGISFSKNQKYIEQVGKCFAKGQWSKVSKLWREAPKMFAKIVSELEKSHSVQEEARNGDAQPAKRRKTQSKLQTLLDLRPRWDAFAKKLEQFDIQISSGGSTFAFSFMEGNLVKAVRNGDWVLLDEINLASPDTLESIADLLTGPSERPSILLSETGEIEKVVAHPNFRIFGAMNPATDVGKRDLPAGIRSRFTELYVRSPDSDLKDLLTIIKTYLGSTSSKHDKAADDVARLYLNTKRLAEERSLVDGANEVPHFSLRTLTRVLSYVNTIAPSYGLRRALYEGFSMGFLTLLNRDSEAMLLPLIHHHLFEAQGNAQSLLSQAPKHPNDGKQYVRFKNKAGDRQYWLFQGNEPVLQRDDYIITSSVERNLLNLVRATSTRRFPILIQGPTSAGKTSMIEYLSNFTGNKFVRINNHEHTDLQEYLGTYISGPDGKLRFQEGLLVQAMRQGHWIVLDELNLAPTDVLEALNRLLDDNRELLIPETQEVVRPHENFILFATQNPPGLYGGRKVLSRAFRNRFLELHFDDIPEDELEFILQQRSRNTSPPDCRRIVNVYKELSRLRQTSRVFEKKDSFATLRDLFRWALRKADSREEIAAHGFMLLAERVRNEEERVAVKEVIEQVFKIKLDPHELYSSTVAPELKTLSQVPNQQGVVWTHAMRRLYVLVSRALRNNEPVLLVGETGCGKTTVCQLLAEALDKQLHIVNAHQNTETGDLIGSQRPVRNRGAILESLGVDLSLALTTVHLDASGTIEERLDKYKSLDASQMDAIPISLRTQIASSETRSKALFEWSDGALVEAMKSGHFFLLDEISLADDSVLERLNSVLEPQRTLLLAEKGTDDSLVTATAGFQMFATMNPGGDFGKKELSPALRNRFTEIWVPGLSESEDIHNIVRSKLAKECKDMVDIIVQFASWFGTTFRSMSSTPFSIRELLAWVQFINNFHSRGQLAALVHGASTIFIDSIGANPSAILAVDAESISQQRVRCLEKLCELCGEDVSPMYDTQPELVLTDDAVSIGDFSISRNPTGVADPGFAFHAPTTRLNGMRILRALQMQKPVLLEGSPGVGKTTLVAALSLLCGQPLTRINLSDQTDLMDLFGTDVPVEGAEAGNFAWRDAPFLQAMQKGEWVLLDEMNLASQSVLEGLNACLDHRGEVYISELDQVFKRHPNFRLFAAQNPHHQGGGRKGLPSSFVNRFVVVYADIFTNDDLERIASHNFPQVPPEGITQLIRFISQMDDALVKQKSFGAQGGPWEFNLRDVLRWLHLLSSSEGLLRDTRIDDFLDIIVKQRFRTQRDRDEVDRLFAEVTGLSPRPHSLYHNITSTMGQVGLALLERNFDRQPERIPTINITPRLAELETMMICVKKNIPCILSSPSGYGKSSLLQHVAALAGKPLVVFPMNADIDTMDLVGGFEQADPLREVNATLMKLRDSLQRSVILLTPDTVPEEALQLLHLLDEISTTTDGIVAIRSSVESLARSIPEDSEVGQLLSSTRELLDRPLSFANPRFEWLDGIIIKALQAGQWLVLDNANMCNASVLDRLNSLLEPNGSLSINENCEPGGEPRIVKPHPEFRIFLTVDPRYGELSRAMRNRAVEIYIHDPPPFMSPCFSRIAEVESSLQRLSMLQGLSGIDTDELSLSSLTEVGIEHITLQDLPVLKRFALEGLSLDTVHQTFSQSAAELLNFVQTQWGMQSLSSVSDLYKSITGPSTAMTSDLPIHPLSNFPLTRLAQDMNQTYWLAMRFEMSRGFNKIIQRLENYRNQAQVTKLGSLSRLQRSLVSDRVAAVSKDSTVRLATFLSSMSTLILEYMRTDASSADSWMTVSRLLRMVMRYLEQTLSLSSGNQFDEAKFSAHLTFGTKLFKSYLGAETLSGSREQALVTSALTRISSDFEVGFRLSTGLSMEMLWARFRPTPVHDETTFVNCLELEKLGSRFDDLRWRSYTPLADLCKAADTLEKAYSIVKGSKLPTTELVQNLSTEIESLEAQIGIDAKEIMPYFKDEFEKLRQLILLYGTEKRAIEGSPSRELTLLSNLPTQLRMHFADFKEQETILDQINMLVCQDQYLWDGKLASSLWSKIQNSGAVSLGSLALLEVELPILARHVADLTAEIGTDPLIRLNQILWQMTLEVFNVHQPELFDTVTGLFKSIHAAVGTSERIRLSELMESEQVKALLDSIEAAHFRQTTAQHFIPAIAALAMAGSDSHQRAHLSAVAWNHFSIGTLLLYVPDRVFDPQIRPQVEREFLQELHADLEGKILTLESFERWHTGQTVNARIHVLQDEISQLDPVPEAVQFVFRPQQSELGRLHAEFANVLKAVNAVAIPSISQSSSTDDGLNLVRENVQRLISRLSSRFEAYQDMTVPTVHLLRCLLIGLSLCDATLSKSLSSQTTQLAAVAPFVGGSLQNASLSSLPHDTFEFLDLASIAVSVQKLDNLDSNATQAVFECFHHFYDDWNRKLEIDRKAEEANTSLYRFRGSMEDEEEVDAEEFNELFPTFEEEEGSTASRPAKVKDQVRDTSIRVAQAHKSIFLSPKEPNSAFSQLCMSMGSRITKEIQDADYIDRNLTELLLPSTVLLLGDKSASLTTLSTNKSYNFYLDENLAEARTLVSLAHRIKSRFKELQSIDEIGHMQPLADVVISCDSLLELVHQEPLAKILPKVEKLHAHVYEWQFGGWASRAHSVLDLHNSLTDTVIRWRRIELSTWANLFDMERSKCEDDAYSWWFIAYQVVVAVPLTMVDNPEEMRRYSVSLLENLETYFSTSILGQFSTRLALLGQLRNHLKYLSQDYPTLDVIYHSLTNFLSYYVRYRKLVEEAIQKGRLPLDKKMKDVLLLASWKDTNINALRESARKSHQKLFRLVRKFRAVLGQDIKTILAQGLPDEEVSLTNMDSSPMTTEEHTHDPELSVMVNSALPAWLDTHRRVANADKTASVISKIAQSPTMTSDIPSTLVDFVSTLDTSMEELRKETPQFLNDENKEQVKHLKTRKRKLFADTLRDLRQMGIRYNLSQDRLAEQESLAIVLSSFSSSEDQSTVIRASDYFLHKVLDLAPQVRASSREHSEDLTSAEMTRSIGFVEGMIHMLLGQRRGIVTGNKSWSSLRRRVDQLQLACSSQTGHLVRAETDKYTPEMLPWLVHIVNFAIHLVEIHGKLGETDHSSVIDQLKSWVNRFAEHQSSLQSLRVSLKQVNTTANVDRWTAVRADIQLFVESLDKMILERPNVGFALREIKLWSQTRNTTVMPTTGLTTALPEFANSVSTLCDRALVAIEHAKKAAAEVPRDQEEAGWVTKHDEAFFTVIKKLHMGGVAANIDRCLELLEQIDLADAQVSQACKALLGLATPILHQFASLCRHVVDQVQYIHRASAQMAFHLTRAFTKISSQGFCTPQEKSNETSGDSGQVESGTGLGDGEGAEDISKDIKDDEDLSELAQEANKEKSGEIEDEKDAVDMADEELEGDMGSVDGADEDEEDGSKKGDEEEEEKEMDEETGEVDDLDPTAVDEKMWDGNDEEEAEKDQQGDKARGQQKDDEQMATEDDTQAAEEQKDDDKKGDEPDQPDPEDVDDEKEDVQAQEELNKQEQTAQDNDTLALPEEMDLDFDDNESASSDSDDLDLASDVEDKTGPEEENEPDKEEEDEQTADNDVGQAKEPDEMEEEKAEDEPEEEGQAAGEDEVQDEVKPEEDEHAGEEQAEEQPLPQQPDNATADKDNAAPSDVKSGGQDQTGDAMELDDEFQDKAAQQDEGEMGQGAADKEAAAGNKGSMSNQAEPVDNNEQEKDSDEPSGSAPFRKLGDALEKWHRQQSDIKDADLEDDQVKQEHKPDEDLSKREFQHLQNDDAAADTQAMGTAKEEEVQPIDEGMAIDEEAQDPNSRLMEEDKEEPNDEVADDVDQADAAETQDKSKQDSKDQDDGRTGVKTRQGNFNKEQDATNDDMHMSEEEDDSIEETSTQLSTTHISSAQRELRDFGECMQQWGDFQNKTHALSLSLTSQLRLILTPSQSTKLSGSFRTGKRLNIKRIIPYIASSYKRDKIWMRRSIPTKRTYQILLCVDDSKSMGESSSGSLAMESLVMVSRSLTMLEAGQVGVVGFGGQVFTAHSLTEPFAADAGGKILQNFTFSQDRTDVALLIRQTIDTFRAARQQSSGGSGAGDLWQLSLILSDGLTPSSAHDSIRRLLREAMEERIMIVFIIMDDTEQKKGDSVLELKEAKFVSEGGESRVVIERYLDTFPFQYYLIVHHLEELPNALAGLLRTWFAEVSA